MRVMKFGGASVKNADAVRNVSQIIRQYSNEPLLVVISAMDKTTNAFEKLAGFAKDCEEARAIAQSLKIKDFHLDMAKSLFGSNPGDLLPQIEGYFKEIDRIIQGILLLGEFPPRTYDRIVCFGELLSTAIVAHYLKQDGLDSKWVDAREIIKTDTSYQHARVIWSLTTENIRKKIVPELKKGKRIITQGFISSTVDGKVTTLGREGSDFSASIFASCLDASSVIVWKDVKGILNGDPRITENPIKIDELSYEDAVEMTFFGATVIHPKTIKPLYNKGIPLEVRCFLDPEGKGSRIGNMEGRKVDAITSTIVKNDQAVIKLSPKDFSFMEASQIYKVFNRASKAGTRVNLIQNSAISLTLCVDQTPSTLKPFIASLLDDFHVSEQIGLTLTTYINYKPGTSGDLEDAVLIQRSEGKLFVVRA